MKSIIQNDQAGECYLCALLHDDWSRKYTEEHHIFFGMANRRLSEKYGLKVRLCLFHHREGPEAVHKNAQIKELLCQIGQQAFERHYPDKNFITLFGENYLEERDMNKVILIGRLTREPDIRHAKKENGDDMVIARYTLAVDRRIRRDEADGQQTADFPSIIAFGRGGEFAERYLHKGTKIIVCGHLQTGSYTNREGQKVYTTDIIADEQEFAESKTAQQAGGSGQQDSRQQAEARENGQPEEPADDGFMNIPDGVDEDIPFH